MVVIAYITADGGGDRDPAPLGLPSEPPEPSPSGGPTQLELWDDLEATGSDSTGAGALRPRGPPSRAGPEPLLEPGAPVADFDWGA